MADARNCIYFICPISRSCVITCCLSSTKRPDCVDCYIEIVQTDMVVLNLAHPEHYYRYNCKVESLRIVEWIATTNSNLQTANTKHKNSQQSPNANHQTPNANNNRLRIICFVMVSTISHLHFTTGSLQCAIRNLQSSSLLPHPSPLYTASRAL